MGSGYPRAFVTSRDTLAGIHAGEKGTRILHAIVFPQRLTVLACLSRMRERMHARSYVAAAVLCVAAGDRVYRATVCARALVLPYARMLPRVVPFVACMLPFVGMCVIRCLHSP